MLLTLPDPSFLSSAGRQLLDPLISGELPARHYDVVVIGAGVAGLAFALRLPPQFRIALLTKGALGESNTRWAQGGLSAAIGDDDSPSLHEEDTLIAGADLCDVDAVHELVEQAPNAVDFLLSLGTNFDRDPENGSILLGREAAHSRRRVLHAGGDATGAEIERALVAGVLKHPSVDVLAGSFAIDLVVESGACRGVLAQLSDGGLVKLNAPVVVVAAGGAGQLWATTSNPPAATADGLAMAIRAGAAVADVEFAQFHPTVLALGESNAFLISEAVRGEGAYLRGLDGERFMVALHPQAELAPRDVVARGIQRQMELEHSRFVHLDLRHLDAVEMRQRFPTIAAELLKRGLDLATDLIPVAPAAHYFMGGIVAGSDGQTTLPGLLALGEAACTGVHGANRLASNSLLEGLVFGLHAADEYAGSFLPDSRSEGQILEPLLIAESEPDIQQIQQSIREGIQLTMSSDVAVIRSKESLQRAAEKIDSLVESLNRVESLDRGFWETTNIALAARAVVSAALLREESRGAHYRSDFPTPNPDLAGKHLVFGGDAGPIWRLTTLDQARYQAGNPDLNGPW